MNSSNEQENEQQNTQDTFNNTEYQGSFKQSGSLSVQCKNPEDWEHQ